MSAVYDEIALHQVNEHWDFQAALKELLVWRDRFDFRVKLQVTEIVIAIGRLKQLLWICGCPARARIAVARFNAVCLDCNEKFRCVTTR